MKSMISLAFFCTTSASSEDRRRNLRNWENGILFLGCEITVVQIGMVLSGFIVNYIRRFISWMVALYNVSKIKKLIKIPRIDADNMIDYFLQISGNRFLYCCSNTYSKCPRKIET